MDSASAYRKYSGGFKAFSKWWRSTLTSFNGNSESDRTSKYHAALCARARYSSLCISINRLAVR